MLNDELFSRFQSLKSQGHWQSNPFYAQKLKLYNTLTKQIDLFVPGNPLNVTLYLCGPTVYDRAHMGNARPAIVFDVLRQVLVQFYPTITFARNITDVDDKIIEAARSKGVSIKDITTQTEAAYLEDMDALGIKRPDLDPHATDHIVDMITMIQNLMKKDMAYTANGHVLFKTRSYPHYGCLSGRCVDDLKMGARIDVASYKKDPLDFVLWKPAKDKEPGWDSPWGYGRPGWHIECSAMIKSHLGETIDIHGGGHDLIFPHHENECAQSYAVSSAPLSRFWLHNGLLQVNGQKMSKSLNNFFTVRDILSHHAGELIRFYMLGTHYRSNFDWTEEGLEVANKGLSRLYLALDEVNDELSMGADLFFNQKSDTNMNNDINTNEINNDTPLYDAIVTECLCADLNTPGAIHRLYALAKTIRLSEDPEEKIKLAHQLKRSGNLLGILNRSLPQRIEDEKLRNSNRSLSDTDIQSLIESRNQARTNKDFAKSDEIRDQLAAQGVELFDGPEGTTWKWRS